MKKRGCGCIIYNDAGKILLGLRCKPNDKPEWCLPGGSIEENETPIQAVKREVLEEVGLTLLNANRVLATNNSITRWRDFVFESYEWIGDPARQQEEFAELRWVTFEEAKSLSLYPDTAAALYALRLL